MSLACGARTGLLAPEKPEAAPEPCIPEDISTRYDATWLFGSGCRADWNAQNVVSFSATSILFTGFEGTIAAADPFTGALFAASDGITLYDGQSQKKNGTPLGANISTSQAVTFLGVPGAGDFYIVTNSANDGEGGGLFQSRLPCGTVTPQGDPKMIDGTKTFTEALAAVKHANGVDRWLLSSSPDGVEVIGVTAAGFGAPVATPFGASLAGVVAAQRAFLVFARDRHTFAMTAEHRGLIVGTFDNATGAVTNIAPIPLPPHKTLYSAAFSPDQTKLYVSEWQGSYWQVDLVAGYATTTLGKAGGALRLAIDDRIYLAFDAESQLDVVSNTNAPASALSITSLALPSGCKSSYGFPGVSDL
jgi:hypothetical protein